MTTYKTIADLPAALQAQDSDLVEVSQAGISRRLTVGQFVAGSGSFVGPTPPATPAPGALWWNTERGELFVWYNDGNSSQWVPSTPTAAPAMTFSVLQFGAVGDGITDDVTAINATVTAANAAGGGIVFMPPGTYLVGEFAPATATAIVMKSNVHLIGSGEEATIIKLKNGSNSHTIACTDITNFSITALSIDGNRINQTVATHTIRSAGVSFARFENLKVRSSGHYGIGFQSGTMTNVVIDKVVLTDIGGDGIDIKNLEDNNSGIQISNVVVESFDQAGSGVLAGIDCRGPVNLSNIIIKSVPVGGSGIRFREGELLATTGLGGHQSNLSNFRVVGTNLSGAIGVAVPARNVKIVNGYVENCGAAGVQVGGDNVSVTNVHTSGSVTGIDTATPGSGGSIIGCIINGASSYGIDLEAGCNSWRIVGNRITNCTTNGIRITVGALGTSVTDNHFSGNGIAINNGDTSSLYNNNVGFVTENRGSFAGSTNASGDIGISHGLILTPKQVVVSPSGSVYAHVQVGSRNSSTITLRCYDAAGVAMASTAVALDWRVWT